MSRAFQLERLANRSFYRCPNDPRRVQLMGKNDNKVMCGCGKPNPASSVSEAVTGNAVHHSVGLLSRATAEDYLNWMEEKYPPKRGEA